MDFSLLPALHLSLTRFSLMQLLWEFINLPLSAHFTATYSVINYEEQKLNFLQNRVEHLDENITFRCELSLGFTNLLFSVVDFVNYEINDLLHRGNLAPTVCTIVLKLTDCYYLLRLFKSISYYNILRIDSVYIHVLLFPLSVL